MLKKSEIDNLVNVYVESAHELSKVLRAQQTQTDLDPIEHSRLKFQKATAKALYIAAWEDLKKACSDMDTRQQVVRMLGPTRFNEMLDGIY